MLIRKYQFVKDDSDVHCEKNVNQSERYETKSMEIIMKTRGFISVITRMILIDT